jgi:Leucine-rich repeat (LRR) protein
VPDIDDDRNTLPPPVYNLLQLEVEAYDRLEKAMERAGYPKSDTASIFMEVAVRKDQFRIALGKGFENSLECSNNFEKMGLKKLFQALRGDSWTKKFGWIGQAKTAQQPEVRMFAASTSLFEGVTVARIIDSVGMMTEINLEGVGCDGQLPEDIENFETTKRFNLSWNDISGRIPKGLRGMSALQTLDLSGNNLTGDLDADVFCELKHAVSIDLSSNRLSGELPGCFADMRFLEVLDLSDNLFVGAIPHALSKTAATLKNISLQKNRLEGELQPWMGTMKELTVLNLSNNAFGGRIDMLWECTKLQRLQLSENDFIGTLSNDVSKLEDLQILFLHKNRLRDSLPVGFCNLTKLRRVNLSCNAFRGSLPRDMGNLVRLESLILEGNRFIGPTPASFTQLTRLRDYSIYKNIPAENGKVSRGFRRHEYDRVHQWAPAQGMNNVTWEYVYISVYYCLPAFSDTTWHESNHHPPPSINQPIINRHNTHINYYPTGTRRAKAPPIPAGPPRSASGCSTRGCT